MWDTVQDTSDGARLCLSHAMPCRRCGHEVHVFLSCGDGCDCQPLTLPGHRSMDLLAS